MKHSAIINWSKSPAELFTDNKYGRAHQWRFDGGATFLASSSPEVVPIPFSDETAIDPEEAFIAAIASCHMLFFLSIAASRRYVVTSYEDHVEGIMANNEQGKMAMIKIVLRPQIHFTGTPVPTPREIALMHESAHDRCFLANSVNSVIEIISN